MTVLEERLYLALMGARTVVAANTAVNPMHGKILAFVDKVAGEYKDKQAQEEQRRVALHTEDSDAA